MIRGWATSLCLLVALAASATPTNTQSFQLVAPLAPMNPRYFATALLLPTGEVLLIGGETGGATWGNAELYDLKNRRLTAMAGLPSRNLSPAVLSGDDGNVYSFGGFQASGSQLPGAAIARYDVVTRTWSDAGTMLVPRGDHTAVVLSDGRILIVGGRSTNGNDRSAELYDPRTRLSTDAGFLSTDRTAGGLASLPDGGVLSAGYFGAEVFDPATATWTVAPGTVRSDYNHNLTVVGDVAVLQGGRLTGASELVDVYSASAGFAPATSLNFARDDFASVRAPDGTLFAFGGRFLDAGLLSSGYRSSVEVLSPDGGAFALTAPLLRERASMSAVLLPGGRVLLVGGYDRLGAVNTHEIYSLGLHDLADAGAALDTRRVVATSFDRAVIAGGGTAVTWNAGATQAFVGGNLPTDGFTMNNLVGGDVLIAGGQRSGTVIDGTYRLVPFGNITPAAPMLNARMFHSATRLPSGQLLVAGGTDSLGAITPITELYDSADDQWRLGPDMPTPTIGHRATLLPDGGVLFTGGRDSSGPTALTQNFSESGGWSVGQNMATPRYDHTASLLGDGRVLIVGGKSSVSGAALASVELFNPATGTSTPGAPLSAPRREHRAVVLRSGRVLVVHGFDATNAQHTTAEIYEPLADRWFTIPFGPGRGEFDIATLTDGSVLVAGGGQKTVRWSEVTGATRPSFSFPGSLRPNSASAISLVGLDGRGELLSGNTLASSSGFPLVMFLNEENGDYFYARTYYWNVANGIGFQVGAVPSGLYAMTIDIAGAPSPGVLVHIGGPRGSICTPGSCSNPALCLGHCCASSTCTTTCDRFGQCVPDGGFPDAGSDAGFDGGVDAGSDGGSDGGAADAGGDAGFVEADAGSDGGDGADAGAIPLERQYLTVGCDCDAAGGVGLLGLLAFVIALRPRRVRSKPPAC